VRVRIGYLEQLLF